MGRNNEALAAQEKAIDLYLLEPMSAQTRYKKGTVLKTLGRNSEANAAFAKAKELGYNR